MVGKVIKILCNGHSRIGSSIPRTVFPSSHSFWSPYSKEITHTGKPTRGANEVGCSGPRENGGPELSSHYIVSIGWGGALSYNIVQGPAKADSDTHILLYVEHLVTCAPLTVFITVLTQSRKDTSEITLDTLRW